MPEVIAILLLDLIFAIFGTIAFFIALKISFLWDMNSSSNRQYVLQKQSYLGSIIIKYIFAIKVPLILFYVFTLDKLSNIINGAMCAAGVVNATSYGTYLLLLKVLNLYIFSYWIYLNNIDVKDENRTFTKTKFRLFVVAYFLLMAELIIEYLMFNAIDTNQLVDCCGAIYSVNSKTYISYIFELSNSVLVSIFYAIYLAVLIGYFLKKDSIYAILNLLFLIISIITLITFFGTYIYEMPTHHCPFCFLQKDYNYIGYFIYLFLFLGTFNAVAVGFLPTSNSVKKHHYNLSILFNSIYVALVSFFVVKYFIVNGVFL